MKLGQWVAMSVVQDGFGFPMLTPPVYDYIVEGLQCLLCKMVLVFLC